MELLINQGFACNHILQDVFNQELLNLVKTDHHCKKVDKTLNYNFIYHFKNHHLLYL